MCTVTLIPVPGGVRLITNRDEGRARSPAKPPAERLIHTGVRAIYPQDTQEGGTWVAVTERGLIFAILNANPAAQHDLMSCARVRDSNVLQSRGLIIPRIASARDIEHAVEIAGELDLDRFSPFRLLITDTQSVQVAAWSRQGLQWAGSTVAPMCLASSGLGDHRVLPRLALFREWLETHGATPDAQDAFHRHVWPDRPEISVMMSRAEARTVSVTTVEVRVDAVRLEAFMSYRDDAGERHVEFAGLRPVAASSA